MPNTNLEDKVAEKLALSKAALQRHRGPLHVSVVFAMFRESERILSSEESPIGEDFLNVKVSQLRELFDGDSGWDMVIVDDGCPDGSGEIAERIIREHGYANCRVLYIADAITAGHPVTRGLGSPDDSRKGGAIQLGMYEAVAPGIPGQVVVYTDADLSTHLGQIGLLVDGLSDGAWCAAGSRREPDSVVVKSGARSDRGKIFIYLWKQMLPQLGHIVDSQCGFKGFPAEVVRSIVVDTVEKQFAFDIELLLRCEIGNPGSIERIAVAWMDSEAGSTTTDLEPYLPMLKAVAKMHRTYSPPDERAETFVELVEQMDKQSWDRLVANIPTPITDREPVEYTTWAGVEAWEVAVGAGLGLPDK